MPLYLQGVDLYHFLVNVIDYPVMGLSLIHICPGEAAVPPRCTSPLGAPQGTNSGSIPIRLDCTGLPAPQAVSYTHLDVYKRQLRKCVLFKFGTPECNLFVPS